jgi:hypothetical protein
VWVFGRNFCENLAENFVPFHHKILREFGRKIFDFVVICYKILREFGKKLCDFRTTADQKNYPKPTYFFI